MKILIFDCEAYLSQKITMKLQEKGHNCLNTIDVDSLNQKEEFDIILISTDINSKDIGKIIKIYSNSAILFLGFCNITMYSKYITTELVYDYITKPFLMDELIRKIDHYFEFNSLIKNNKTLESYKTYIETQQVNNKVKESCFNSLESVNEYIKNVIKSFEINYTETQLSSKLGISRKTLWARRKKLNI